jgi:hypothetical protein
MHKLGSMTAMVTFLTESKRHNCDIQKQMDDPQPPFCGPSAIPITEGLVYSVSGQFVSIAALFVSILSAYRGYASTIESLDFKICSLARVLFC